MTSDFSAAVFAGQLGQAGLSVSEEGIVKHDFFANWTLNADVLQCCSFLLFDFSVGLSSPGLPAFF
jgi:hypothetical protein